MTSAIRINHFEKKILISKSFQKAAMNPTCREYAELMEVMANHPDYKLDQRAIKTNPKKDTYKGLTYEYMRDYIILHSTPEEEAAPVSSCVIVCCAPSIVGTIVTIALATSMSAMCLPLLCEHAPQLGYCDSALSEVVPGVVFRSRVRLRVFRWFMLCHGDQIRVDLCKHVEDVRQNPVRL